MKVWLTAGGFALAFIAVGIIFATRADLGEMDQIASVGSFVLALLTLALTALAAVRRRPPEPPPAAAAPGDSAPAAAAPGDSAPAAAVPGAAVPGAAVPGAAVPGAAVPAAAAPAAAAPGDSASVAGGSIKVGRIKNATNVQIGHHTHAVQNIDNRSVSD